ncbi:hypothetical protein AX16_003926 [Volvariella volvacea WC 439]|nr:hypothetical protein AX16_003926 [Volvariella volvacea WC 439]
MADEPSGPFEPFEAVLNCIVYPKPLVPELAESESLYIPRNTFFHRLITPNLGLDRVFQVRVSSNATVDQVRDEVFKKMQTWQYWIDVYDITLYSPPPSKISLVSDEVFSRHGADMAPLPDEWRLNPIHLIVDNLTLRAPHPEELHIIVKAPWEAKPTVGQMLRRGLVLATTTILNSSSHKHPKTMSYEVPSEE